MDNGLSSDWYSITCWWLSCPQWQLVGLALEGQGTIWRQSLISLGDIFFLSNVIPWAQTASPFPVTCCRCSKFLCSGCASKLLAQVLPAPRFSMASTQFSTYCQYSLQPPSSFYSIFSLPPKCRGDTLGKADQCWGLNPSTGRTD